MMLCQLDTELAVMALSVLLEEHAEFDTVARKGDPALLQALAGRMCGGLSVCVCVCVCVGGWVGG